MGESKNYNKCLAFEGISKEKYLSWRKKKLEDKESVWEEIHPAGFINFN
jgi:hypothetical protein